jgi:hypothetical protein
MPTEHAAPVLVRAAVENLHQRPDQAGLYPRVLVRVHAARSSQGITDQATWRRKYDVCADAVRAARVRPERARQRLGDPPLDTPRWNRDNVRNERIRGYRCKDIRQTSDQHVGTLCTVQSQRHATPRLGDGPDDTDPIAVARGFERNSWEATQLSGWERGSREAHLPRADAGDV